MTKKPTKAALLRAVGNDEELLRRLLVAAENAQLDEGEAVVTPERAVELFRPHVLGLEYEQLLCIGLDRRRRVVAIEAITRGSDGFTIVDPRQIFRWALTRSRPVSAVILAHNHPSGDPTPSRQDIEVTERVARAGHVLGIPLLDHIVVCDHRHRSMAEMGAIPRLSSAQAGWTN